MAKKASTAPKSLNVANLETLGAARLAALLMEITAGDAAARRRLKLAIAGEAGPAATAHAIAKRLASIARSKTFLERHQVDPLARELKAQHDAILKLVAPSDPRQAFDLIWQLLTALAQSSSAATIATAVYLLPLNSPSSISGLWPKRQSSIRTTSSIAPFSRCKPTATACGRT